MRQPIEDRYRNTREKTQQYYRPMPSRHRLESSHSRDGIELQILPERPLVGETRATVGSKPGSGERRV